jgi:hypothetical protein
MYEPSTNSDIADNNGMIAQGMQKHYEGFLTDTDIDTK